MNLKTTIDASEVAKFSQYADEWWDTNGPLKTLHDINPTRIQFIEKFITLKDQAILDVGCGGGVLAEGLAQNGAKVTGIDVAADAIDTAKQHAVNTKLTLTYDCIPIENFEASPFDAITCMEMLEHVKNPELIIQHCVRLLKPGGYLFLSTLNRTLKAYASAILAAEYLLRLLPRQTHDYDKFIKPSELAEIVRNAGLEVVGLEGMDYHPFLRMAELQSSVDVNYLMACYKA